MDLLCIDNNYTAEYEDSILTSGFAPLISIYTHERPNCKKTCIDNILTNDFEDIIFLCLNGFSIKLKIKIDRRTVRSIT